MTGKQVEYTSVPYKSILAFSIETAGSVDTDQELKLYAHGIGKVSIDLVKSIDVMPIHRFLNSVGEPPVPGGRLYKHTYNFKSESFQLILLDDYLVEVSKGWEFHRDDTDRPKYRMSSV